MLPDPDQLFSDIDLAGRRAVVAAVSGGSDSIALLVLLRDWLGRRAPPVRLLAVTVDHRLRPESADEACRVAAFCRSLGVEHRIMAWADPRPGTGVSAAAREARYDLLAQAAEEAGTDIVMTGHTMDDQAETVRMRGARSVNERGLAAMAPTTLFDERVWIVRPLLGTRRHDLRALLAGRNLGWIDDPTNENPAYERVRIRNELAALPRDEIGDLAERAGAAGRHRTALSEAAADLIDRFATRAVPGLFRLDAGLLDGDPEAVLHALRILLATAGGRSHLPDEARARTLLGRLASGPVRATLSRAVIDRRRDVIWIYREARDLPDIGIVPGTFTWDGRWRVQAARAEASLHIAPFGRSVASDMATDISGVPQSLAEAALSREPAIFRGNECIGLAASQPGALGVGASPVAAPFARFLGSFDLAAATSVRHLLELKELPALPLRKHIAV